MKERKKIKCHACGASFIPVPVSIVFHETEACLKKVKK